MHVIWEFPLAITDRQDIRMPIGARILSVGNQEDVLTLWARVDPKAKLVPTTIAIYGTGNPIGTPESDEVHIGTVQMGPLVWHCYMRFPEDA